MCQMNPTSQQLNHVNCANSSLEWNMAMHSSPAEEKTLGGKGKLFYEFVQLCVYIYSLQHDIALDPGLWKGPKF